MLTTENLPKAIIRTGLQEREYKELPNVELIAGHSIIVNRAGKIYIYMGDDKRREIPIQIIAADFMGNLAYLPIRAKMAIELINAK